jgi:hypothetical protein
MRKHLWLLFFPALFIAITFVHAAAPTNGLASYYSFDTDATDATGTNNGTITGAISSSGKIGNGLSFDGVDDQVRTQTVTFVSSQNSPHSMFAWVKPNSSGLLGIVSYGELDDSSITTGLGIYNGNLAWLKNGLVNGMVTSNLTVPINEWSFVGMVRTPTQVIFYVNSNSQTLTNTSATTIGTDPILIGATAANRTAHGFFKGMIDEVRLYTRDLLQNEVGDIYALGGGTQVPTAPPSTGTTTETPPPPQTQTGPKTYSVKKDGTGDFAIIQACADMAKAGDTCLVSSGTYPEQVVTKAGGAGDTQRITFKTNGTVTVHGFRITHPYVTVEGFDITGFTTAFNGHINITKGGDYCHIINNVIRDGAVNVSGIFFPLSSDRTTGNNCLIRNNKLRNLNSTFLSINGANHTVEYNTYERLNSRDFIYVFGHGHVFRGNIFRDGNTLAGVGNHPDWIQTFGDNGGESYDMLFENNWIENLESQLGQIDGGGRGIVSVIHDWTFRNNVFISVSNNMNSGLPGVRWEHNTFYRMSYTQNGIGIYGSLSRGDSSRNVLINNAFVAGGSNPMGDKDIRGFYNLSGASLTTEVLRLYATNNDSTVALDIARDLTSQGYLVNPNGQLTAKSKALTDISQFVMSDPYAAYKAVIYDLLVRTAQLDKSIRGTTVADYNFVSGSGPNFYPKSTTCTDGIFTQFSFCETHGINGGNPQFKNESDPDGQDNIPFTLDDGLKPLPTSPLCGKGYNGTDIGAYSCSTSVVFSVGSGTYTPPPQPPPQPVAGDFNTDGYVNTLDSSYMNSKWNTNDAKADLNKDGIVNTLDYAIMVKNWSV